MSKKIKRIEKGRRGDWKRNTLAPYFNKRKDAYYIFLTYKMTHAGSVLLILSKTKKNTLNIL